MSLPTYAQYYNIYGDKIGDSFVNIGWFISEIALFRVLTNELPQNVYTDPRIHYMEIYGFTFPIEMVCDLKRSSPEDGVRFLEDVLT